MNCKVLESLIALYVEGDLSASDRRRVETHLHSCANCWDLAEDLRESQTVFKALRAGTVKSSDLAGVRERVLNEVGDLEPAPGWVIAMHRLFFAGLRRRNAIAGVMLALLVSGSVWYLQKPVVREAKREVKIEVEKEAPIEVARLDAPVISAPPKVFSPSFEPTRIVTPAALPETRVEVPPETPAEPAVVEPIPSQVQVSQFPPMKFVTDDPNIIIYWLPTDKGD